MEINGLQEYLKSIGKYKILTFEEEQKLFKQIEEGDISAKQKIIESNLKLVVTVAKKYRSWSDMSFLDLIQEGAFGLMTAVDKFDYKLGYKFSTYAVYWIKQSISKAIVNKSKTIRLPAHIANKINKIKNAEKELQQKLHRDPTFKEIAEIVNINEQEVKDIYQISLSTVSLDTPVGEEDDATLGELLEDKHYLSPASAAIQSDLRKQLLAVMDSLDKREKIVLIKRYGILDNEPMTLEEVGAEIGLSRERIRQIEEKALWKMRNPIRSEQLKIFIDEGE